MYGEKSLASEAPSPETIAELLAQWIDPITEEPPGTRYRLYPTPARGSNTQGSYLIYLPPSYEQNISKHFPVIYWLHAGFESARQGAWAVQKYDAAIKAKVMPEVIIVLPQALPVGWHVDSKDGKLPIEQVIIKNLIPHIDATYRTIARKEGRGIEGHSMGGFGALHLGLKHPNLFGAISAIAPSILRDLSEEPTYRTYYTFNGDQNYYEEVGPWHLAKLNARVLNWEKTKLRILCGEYDSRLLPALHEYHEWLKKLNVEHEFVTVKGAGHDYREIFEGYGQYVFTFWANAFKDF
ncbi:MAG: prolyl oligopeptidase family serine peptidase [Candidatus Brockarchaeota archaeon]|nr:prolyl oligopeptidase family serine peptidase [Candidatus Brockarchaeota archaeon]MBO3810229.1 prolyl oligopeptidase family serine peptidase [Candidatus Brockarchaeota archaeon]